MSENKDKKPTQTFDLLECDQDDVICFGKEDIYKISKFKAALYADNFDLCYRIINMLSNEGIKIEREIIGDTGEDEDYKNLVQGIDCSILQQSGGGWKKGKFKMKLILETWDDEEQTEKSESLLDDIRRSLSENGS